jgi:hypothetical protein
MKKNLVLLLSVLFLWACVGSLPGPATSQRASPGSEESSRPPASRAATSEPALVAPDSLIFAGRSVEEIYVAAKIALADLRYTIKSSDPVRGLLIAVRTAAETGAGGQTLPMATAAVFNDPGGNACLRVQIIRPVPAAAPSGEDRTEIENILAAVRDLLR